MELPVWSTKILTFIFSFKNIALYDYNRKTTFNLIDFYFATFERNGAFTKLVIVTCDRVTQSQISD